MERASRRRGPAFKKYLIGLSILFALLSIGRLFVVLFNIHPYFNISRTTGVGLLDYADGLPVDATTGLKIAQTSVKTYYTNGFSLISLPTDGIYNLTHSKNLASRKGKQVVKTDSIFTHVNAYDVSGVINKDIAVNAIVMNEVKFYIETKKLGYKLYYTYPDILNSLVASYCFWLLAQFISAIQAGGSFSKKNRLRLQNIGWAILILQGAYFVVEFIPPLVNYFEVSYTATIPAYRSNFDFHADPVKPFSIMWLLIGALVLVLASAFRDGEILQEDKDLTI